MVVGCVVEVGSEVSGGGGEGEGGGWKRGMEEGGWKRERGKGRGRGRRGGKGEGEGGIRKGGRVRAWGEEKEGRKKGRKEGSAAKRVTDRCNSIPICAALITIASIIITIFVICYRRECASD